MSAPAQREWTAPMPTTRTALDTEWFRSTLEAAGCRCTRQRRAVYEYLVGIQPYHPTAEDVFRGVKRKVPRISLATVYKALEALDSCGMILKLPASGDGSARFDARCEPHYHLRCLKSGRVDDLPTAFDPDLLARLDPDLASRLAAIGFQLTGYRLELFGYYENGTPPAAASHETGDE
jgi:Fe2+ or Zn2+ uptake regulation protein